MSQRRWLVTVTLFTIASIAYRGYLLPRSLNVPLSPDLSQAHGALGSFVQPEPEEPILQKLYKKKGFTKAQEIALACKEVDCAKECQDKAAEKCTSDTCLKVGGQACWLAGWLARALTGRDGRQEKTKICRKTCAKERCDERCKAEPDMSYVARELKLEKCVDACDESNTKCKARCEDEAKTCKVRCKDRLKAILCVRSLDTLNAHDDDEADVQALAGDGPL
jgi:hypothetical protein